MANGLARRIQWLMPDPQREVYKTGRSGAGRPCVRCGNDVRENDIRFEVRDRGTLWVHREVLAIHRRCVPTRDFQTRGLPARGRGLSGVERAHRPGGSR